MKALKLEDNNIIDIDIDNTLKHSRLLLMAILKQSASSRAQL